MIYAVVEYLCTLVVQEFNLSQFSKALNKEGSSIFKDLEGTLKRRKMDIGWWKYIEEAMESEDKGKPFLNKTLKDIPTLLRDMCDFINNLCLYYKLDTESKELELIANLFKIRIQVYSNMNTLETYWPKDDKGKAEAAIFNRPFVIVYNKTGVSLLYTEEECKSFAELDELALANLIGKAAPTLEKKEEEEKKKAQELKRYGSDETLMFIAAHVETVMQILRQFIEGMYQAKKDNIMKTFRDALELWPELYGIVGALTSAGNIPPMWSKFIWEAKRMEQIPNNYPGVELGKFARDIVRWRQAAETISCQLCNGKETESSPLKKIKCGHYLHATCLAE